MYAPLPAASLPGGDDYAVSRGHAWRTFAILFVLMMFDFVDRSVVASMFPYIRQDWRLTDAELGALASIVPLMVGVLVVPTAALVDRWSRVKSIMLMGTVWSLASVGCMFAGSYGSLLAFRGIVGAGEAGYGPAGAALLAHHFPTRMRCTVVGGFLFACALGTMAGIVAGGVLASRWGWQAAFGIVGVPGLVAALLVLTIRDFDTVPVHAAVRDGARVLDAARELFRAPSMWAICVGSGLGMMEAMAISVWAPSFFERTYGLDGAAAGVKAAPVILACAVGTVLWGAVADRASLRTPRRRLDVTTGCCVATIAILFPAFLWMQSGHAQYVAILLGALAIGGFVGIPFAAVMDVTPRGLRATACAVLVLANNAIASATGPFVTGLLSDRVGLPHALALVTLFALPTAACFAWAARHYEADARRVGAAESPVAFTIAAPAPMT